MDSGLCLPRGRPQTHVMQVANKEQRPRGGVTIALKRVTALIFSAGTGNRVFVCSWDCVCAAAGGAGGGDDGRSAVVLF